MHLGAVPRRLSETAYCPLSGPVLGSHREGRSASGGLCGFAGEVPGLRAAAHGNGHEAATLWCSRRLPLRRARLPAAAGKAARRARRRAARASSEPHPAPSRPPQSPECNIAVTLLEQTNSTSHKFKVGQGGDGGTSPLWTPLGGWGACWCWLAHPSTPLDAGVDVAPTLLPPGRLWPRLFLHSPPKTPPRHPFRCGL
jgi:hypothetical protein